MRHRETQPPEYKNSIARWLEANYTEVSAREFYRDIFPEGELEKAGEYVTGKYTGIIVAVTNSRKVDGKRRVLRYNLTDDLGAIDTVTASKNFCLCSPISYAGKERTAENARMLYAIVIDVDKVIMTGRRPSGLINLMERHVELVERLPRPSYIVSSGSGVHLYYVLTEPIPLYENNAKALQEYKRELTRLVWHDTIVNIKSASEVQQEGIYQGFRMPETITKDGARARAYRTGTHVTMEYLNSFVNDRYKVRLSTIKKNKLTLSAAAEKYPEWYERRIVQGQERGVWCVSRNVYDWWLERIKRGATVGHRYYCLMMLAVYAQKCSHYDEKHNPQPVTREELERDCFSLLEHMDKMTETPNNHFTEEDVLDALEAFDERWTTYPRASIEYRTAISIPRNKRNGRKAALHLKIARTTLEVLNEANGKALQGRKDKQFDIELWRAGHPDGTKADCIRDTGLSKPTVYKWW